MNIETILEYIKTEQLDGKSREQFYVYRRHYLCYRLYKSQEFTLSQIGRLFNRDHSTVLNSIKKHEELQDDKLYQRMIEKCVKLFDGSIQFTKQTRDIFDDISKANNLEKLRRIKSWLKEGRYDEQINAIADKIFEKINT